MASANLVDENEITNRYLCGICRGILSSPCRPKDCQHLFCKECLYNWYTQKNICPVCLKHFNFNEIITDHRISFEIHDLYTNCATCKKTIKLTNLQKHLTECDTTSKNQRQGLNSSILFQNDNVQGATGFSPKNSQNKSVNRYTFKCPYCNEQNLTVDALRDHCNKYHANCERHVVCPVCTAMPWGDKNQKSTNFLDHLNLRHKFEYDRYVDFNLNDEEALSEAIKFSLQTR